MKKLLFFWLLLGFVACQHEDTTFRSEGRITGVDLRLCGCCGGWFIDIDGDTYLAYINPVDVEKLNLKVEDIPIDVRLNWKLQPTNCLENYIIVNQIERR